MLSNRIRQTEKHLIDFIQNHFGLKIDTLTVEAPPKTEFGDLAFPFPFELAKQLRRSPKDIANEVVENIDTPDYVERFTTAGGGYINLFFKRTQFFEELYSWLQDVPSETKSAKVIVEHTNINPNKAAHIGHLRNATLGDTLVRALRTRGKKVEVQNYIDNTGVQVADIVVGFQQLRKMSLEQVESIENPFDYYCWDLYAEVSNWYRQHPSNLQLRDKTLTAIEKNEAPTSKLANYISTRIVVAHLKTMLRLGVKYQVLPRESEILQLQFWKEAFELLKSRRAIQYQDSGPNKGCWVMQIGEKEEKENQEKIIVRSNGTVTYVGKDIAYQLWKFGLLSKTFYFAPFYQYKKDAILPVNHVPDNDTVWVTTTEESVDHQPPFGQGSLVYNVIDVRQSYLQNVVVQGLKRLGFEKEADRSIHFSYEMVALSPACCKELNIELSEEDRGKPHIEVSGRKGLGVKADDLINKLIEKSIEEIDSRRTELNKNTKNRIATQIAIGALRYFLIKYTRNSIISFDFNEALNFEGETGPYLQYSVVRANNILRRLAEQPKWSNSVWEKHCHNMWSNPSSITELINDDETWALLMQIGRIDEIIEQAVTTLEMSILAKQTFNLAQQFNLFYHKHHILSERNPVAQCFYVTVVNTARMGLLKMLDLLGIQVPEKM